MKSVTKFEVNYNGTKFLMDVADGNLMSLNDIYVAAGSPANKEPWRWLDTEESRQFIDSIAEILNLNKSDILKSKRGRHGGGTWTVKEICDAYSLYLSKSVSNRITGLYVVMFSNGVIKVGKSINVLARIKQHESNANAYGLFIINRHSIDETDITEQELLAYCRGLASKDEYAENHHGEYFIGIDFDKVKKFLGYKEPKSESVKVDCVRKSAFNKKQDSLFV